MCEMKNLFAIFCLKSIHIYDKKFPFTHYTDDGVSRKAYFFIVNIY